MNPMWLVISWWAALLATAAYIGAERSKALHLDWLCLMLWGLAAMVLVDHIIGYAREGGEFLELTPEAALVGVIMLIPIVLIWEIAALLSRAKRRRR